jgi:hypothetical protein
MYARVEEHVLNAADEFRAAANATTKNEQRVHRDAARDWVLLIQCNGSYIARRIRNAREAANVDQGTKAQQGL